jgi:hypothetical protein
MPAFLRLALQASIAALDKAQYYSLSKSTEAFRAAYAYLIAARGGLDDPFLVAGAADLARLFPANSQTVSATQTNENELQTLISSTPAGGIIRLNEGVYRVRAVLTHDVTIQGVLPDDTILQGLAWDAVLAIASEELVHVTLKDLTIQGGESGVAAWTHSENGSIDLTLDNVTLEDNGTAVIAATQTNLEATGCRFVDNKLGIRSNTDDEEVLVRLANCTFDGNESALYAYGSQTVTLENCQILNGTDADGDIVVSNAARLDMRDCEIHRVTGRGIVLANTASMALIDSVIETADSPAIAVASTHRDTSGRVVTDCGISLGPTDSDLPLGTVTGYGNSITGGVCPTILEFLTDPNPDAQ